MKKSLLIMAAGLLTTSLFAGTAWKDLNLDSVPGANAQPNENKYWVSTDYPDWDSVASKRLISFNDSSWSVTGLSGLTDFTVAGVADFWSVNTDNRYSNLVKTGSELTLTFNPSVKEYSNFQFNMQALRNADGIAASPTATTDSMGSFLSQGYVVDMREDFLITGEIFIPDNFVDQTTGTNCAPNFAVRASVVDAHGHEWNAGGDSQDTILTTEFGDWVSFSIDYPALEATGWMSFDATPGDAWGEAQHNMPRPIGKDSKRMPIDTANITGVRFYLEPGQLYSATTTYTIKVRNIVIGTPLGAKALIPSKNPNAVAIAEVAPVAFKQNGAAFEVEGAAALYNVLGSKVAAGKGKVSAPAAGLYILVVDGKAAKVTVK